MTIIVHVQEEDFLSEDPVMHALIRQRYPITSTELESYRNGMQYINVYDEIFELDLSAWLELKRQVPKVYVLRYKGCAHLSVRAFLKHLNYLDTTKSNRDSTRFRFDDYSSLWEEPEC